MAEKYSEITLHQLDASILVYNKDLFLCFIYLEKLQINYPIL